MMNRCDGVRKVKNLARSEGEMEFSCVKKHLCCPSAIYCRSDIPTAYDVSPLTSCWPAVKVPLYYCWKAVEPPHRFQPHAYHNIQGDLDGVLASPFSSCVLISGTVSLVDMCDLGHQRIVRVGVCQHRADGEQNF